MILHIPCPGQPFTEPDQKATPPRRGWAAGWCSGARSRACRAPSGATPRATSGIGSRCPAATSPATWPSRIRTATLPSWGGRGRRTTEHVTGRTGQSREADGLIQQIAGYTLAARIDSAEAWETARYCLLDALGCGLLALGYPACSK